MIIIYIHISIISRCVDTVLETSAITTATNEAYGEVKLEERNERYELMDIISPPPSSAKVEEMYEVPPFPSAASQHLPSLPSPSAVAQAEEEEETVYDVIAGDTGDQ